MVSRSGVPPQDLRPQIRWFSAGLLVVTLTYGLVGMLIKIVEDRLVGLWSVLVAKMLDIGLFQDPMFTMGDLTWWMEWLPGYHGMQVIMDAWLTAELDSAVHLGWETAYLAVLGLLTIGAFDRKTRLR